MPHRIAKPEGASRSAPSPATISHASGNRYKLLKTVGDQGTHSDVVESMQDNAIRGKMNRNTGPAVRHAGPGLNLGRVVAFGSSISRTVREAVVSSKNR